MYYADVCFHYALLLHRKRCDLTRPVCGTWSVKLELSQPVRAQTYAFLRPSFCSAVPDSASPVTSLPRLPTRMATSSPSSSLTSARSQTKPRTPPPLNKEGEQKMTRNLQHQRSREHLRRRKRLRRHRRLLRTEEEARVGVRLVEGMEGRWRR
jgi:hypothetical protein